MEDQTRLDSLFEVTERNVENSPTDEDAMFHIELGKFRALYEIGKLLEKIEEALSRQ